MSLLVAAIGNIGIEITPTEVTLTQTGHPQPVHLPIEDLPTITGLLHLAHTQGAHQ